MVDLLPDNGRVTATKLARPLQNRRMGYPRAFTIDQEQPGFYHCISRCVRRAWLCGKDPVTGRCFDHRRDWIEQRLLTLADSFAVGLYAWAVMSNHTHVVLRVDPKLPDTWSDEDVARRWARLDRTLEAVPRAKVEQRIRGLLNQPKRIAELRCRLGSLSWFMRYLNECIARAANAEDLCTGRFWEGRFKCQALLDSAAVIACMAYVDLNPIRAGIADELIDSDFTTIQRRLRSLNTNPDARNATLDSVAGVSDSKAICLTVAAYLDLLANSGRLASNKSVDVTSKRAIRALKTIRGSPTWWMGCVSRVEDVFGSVVGVPRTLRDHASEIGRRSFRGAGATW